VGGWCCGWVVLWVGAGANVQGAGLNGGRARVLVKWPCMLGEGAHAHRHMPLRLPALLPAPSLLHTPLTPPGLASLPASACRRGAAARRCPSV
jgi:hypothetical protein